MPVHSERQAQVETFIFNEAFIEVPAEYSDNNKEFLKKNAVELPENTRINEYAIELEKGKQLPFGPIYSLGPIDLKILKTYIKTNLANGFIRLSKSPAGAPTFFDRKPDKSLHLYINYWGLNNITIKNQYPLLLIGKLLDWLGRAKRFTQLDLINAYYKMRICEIDK